MVSPENTNWLYDYGFEDYPVLDADLSSPNSGFSCPLNALNGTSNVWGIRCSEGILLKKENPNGSCPPSSSKACREKQRRDRLNDNFMELGSVLEPGRHPKTDKSAILLDAVRMVTQLRDEAQKMKDSNSNLQEKIKELKAEKNELRDKKQRLKTDKVKLEQQLMMTNAPQPGLFPASAAFAAQSQTTGNKLVPIISYHGVAMWQFIPPAAIDTSQDHVLRPPVA